MCRREVGCRGEAATRWGMRGVSLEVGVAGGEGAVEEGGVVGGL